MCKKQKYDIFGLHVKEKMCMVKNLAVVQLTSCNSYIQENLSNSQRINKEEFQTKRTLLSLKIQVEQQLTEWKVKSNVFGLNVPFGLVILSQIEIEKN